MGIHTKIEKKIVGDGNVLERRIDYESSVVDRQYMTQKVYDSEKYFFNGQRLSKLDGQAMWENIEHKRKDL